MSKEELLERLRTAGEDPDTEDAHADADQALIDFIDDEEIRTAYEDVPKWYA